MENTDAKFMLDDYVLEEEIGSGANAIVFRGHKANNGSAKVAIKLVNTDSSIDEDISQQSMIDEARILKNLDHPHILKFITLKENGSLCINKKESDEKFAYSVMQLAKKGGMLDFLTEGGAFPEPVARYYFHQLVSGIAYIHKMGYVHRDLKPDNLLIGSDYELLIADFGHATLHLGPKKNGLLSQTSVGTPCYNPPEMSQKSYRGIPVDIFMAGSILFIFLTGLRPFNYAEKDDIYYKHFATSDSAGFWNAHSQRQKVKLSSDARSLISGLLAYDPSTRPRLEEVMKHNWMSGPIASEKEVKSLMRDRYRNLIAKDM